ncbi:MAG TPA: radical SAM protein [Jatrophihabitantaceae bacterium]|nr:radical SAM protein [Jatrophihabitantaceae bacterium]
MSRKDKFRLAWFFTRLAAKERIRPNLHVRPLVAELFLTDNCNLRCVTCNCWRHTTKNELSTAEWKDVLNQLAALRFYKVNFTGGEPLIRRDSIELMQYAWKIGIRHLHLNTNGIRLTPQVMDRVIEAGVRSFNVSVDGPSALVHDRVRGQLGAFEKTTTHLRHLIERRERDRLKVRMNFTVMRDNVQHLPAMAALAQELEVQLYLNLATDKTFLFRAEEVGELTRVGAEQLDTALAGLEAVARRNPSWLPRYSDLAYMRGHFSDLVQRDLPCAESQLKLMIHSRGEIGGCWAHDPTFNVRTRAVRAVIDSDEYRAEHARFFRKECIGCGSNYSLNLRWRPTTYGEDLLWRLRRRSLRAR